MQFSKAIVSRTRKITSQQLHSTKVPEWHIDIMRQKFQLPGTLHKFQEKNAKQKIQTIWDIRKSVAQCTMVLTSIKLTHITIYAVSKI
jgi:hypothetical protein